MVTRPPPALPLAPPPSEARMLSPDGRTNGQTASGRQTRRHVRGGTLPAGEAGEREHLPEGLRSSHGFCESGSPLMPVAGRSGASGEGMEYGGTPFVLACVCRIARAGAALSSADTP
ncbi:unnamed protein product [Pleuronectes platessa]|uniref:Uncharacterized protein n=1 Tax=Pleuronectes platessa TaxID=8262 RepID=A0A9N7YCC0_PLEPL|nr:unnamed protein product [Pleuronectes platessa]